jgi:hypothetical protein
MPKFALANSLWIGRYSGAFLWQGTPLSPMTWLLLALERPVIQKVTAEKQKPGVFFLNLYLFTYAGS